SRVPRWPRAGPCHRAIPVFRLDPRRAALHRRDGRNRAPPPACCRKGAKAARRFRPAARRPARCAIRGRAMSGLWKRMKERKLVQWPLAYLAAAWLLVQVCDVLGAQFGWSAGVLRGITLAFGTGFFLVLIAAWYHGEKGRQKVGAMELSLVALVLAIGGVLLWRFAPSAPGVEVPQAAANAGESANGVDAAIPAKSVAVLPLANQSGDAD